MINELNYNLIIIKKEFNKSNDKISKIINKGIDDITRVDEWNNLKLRLNYKKPLKMIIKN